MHLVIMIVFLKGKYKHIIFQAKIIRNRFFEVLIQIWFDHASTNFLSFSC